MRVLYYGCTFGVGHRFAESQAPGQWQHIYYTKGANAVPWRDVDAALAPVELSTQQYEGLCNLHFKQGWTALAYWDRSVDTRRGSNSVTFFEAPDLMFEDAVEIQRQRFPFTIDRLNFKLELFDLINHDICLTRGEGVGSQQV